MIEVEDEVVALRLLTRRPMRRAYLAGMILFGVAGTIACMDTDFGEAGPSPAVDASPDLCLVRGGSCEAAPLVAWGDPCGPGRHQVQLKCPDTEFFGEMCCFPGESWRAPPSGKDPPRDEVPPDASVDATEVGADASDAATDAADGG